MEKKLFRVGNSGAVLINKKLLQYAKITPESIMTLRMHNKTLFIRKKPIAIEHTGKDRKVANGAEGEESVGWEKKLYKHGNSYAIILDGVILDLLGLETYMDPLELQPYNSGLTIRKRPLTRAEKARKKQAEREANEEHDLWRELEIPREKTPSEKLILKDGKWVLIE